MSRSRETRCRAGSRPGRDRSAKPRRLPARRQRKARARRSAAAPAREPARQTNRRRAARPTIPDVRAWPPRSPRSLERAPSPLPRGLERFTPYGQSLSGRGVAGELGIIIEHRGEPALGLLEAPSLARGVVA